jgi:MFS family permease
VAVMTMTPLHMREHGHDGESSYVIALHVVGMYGLAPFVGRLSDRWGRLRTILLGASIMVAATLVSAAAGTEPPLLFLGLFLLGLGWSGSMISGTALVSDNVPMSEKVGVQGAVDLIMSLCGGAAAFSSGFIKDMLAYHTLSLIGAGLAGGLLLFSLVTLRASAPPKPALG